MPTRSRSGICTNLSLSSFESPDPDPDLVLDQTIIQCYPQYMSRESKISKFAKIRSRDAHGHFIPVSKTANPLQDIRSSFGSPRPQAEAAFDSDDDLVDVQIHNPFHKILKILNDIKMHQSTTFAFRFTIPLIALPIFLLAAFQLGRAQTSCATQISSKIGTIEQVTAQIPKDSPGIWATIWSFLPSIPSLTPQKELIGETRTLLVDARGETLTIVHPTNIHFEDYRKTRVILTGKLSVCTSTLTVDSPQNITLTL